MTEDNKKQLITIIERSVVLLLIIALAIIMRWSSNQIKERREAYLSLGLQEEELAIRPVPVKKEEGRSVEEAGGDAEFYFNEGLRFARTGRFKEAIAALHKTIEINPLHYRAMSNLGLVYKNIFLENRNPELLEKAIELYKKAIDIEPNFPDVYNNLGDAYFNQERYVGAEEAFSRAIQLDPLNMNAYNNLGVALIMQNKKEEALECWRKSLEINPHQPNIEEYIRRNE